MDWDLIDIDLTRGDVLSKPSKGFDFRNLIERAFSRVDDYAAATWYNPYPDAEDDECHRCGQPENLPRDLRSWWGLCPTCDEILSSKKEED